MTAVVTCRDLSCGYGEQPVLSDVDLEVQEGQIIALLGGSGSGKSTLLRTIIGLQPPLGGQVRLLGEDISELEPRELHRLLRRVGMLFQHDALLASETLLDNVGLPLRQHSDLPEPVIQEIAAMKLDMVGLGGLEHRLPDAVSGGQRKRAALARAAALDPDVIFFDEPTSGLDPVVAAGIEALLLQFRERFGMSMLLVTHELETVRQIADRAIMLGEGGIRAEGTVSELERRDDPLTRAFFHRTAPGHISSGRSVLARIEQSQSRSRRRGQSTTERTGASKD